MRITLLDCRSVSVLICPWKRLHGLTLAHAVLTVPGIFVTVAVTGTRYSRRCSSHLLFPSLLQSPALFPPPLLQPWMYEQEQRTEERVREKLATEGTVREKRWS